MRIQGPRLLFLCAGIALHAAISMAQVGPRPPISQRPIYPARANGAFACLADQGTVLTTSSLLPLPPLAGRDLSGSVVSSLRMTNDQCRASCGSQNAPLAGTQSGGFCFCGSDAGHYGPSQHCTSTCLGYPGEICGGPLANSVSLTGALGFNPVPVPAPPANGGQCVLDVSGPMYRHFEVQTWTVSGPPVTLPTGQKQYPMSWGTAGGGAYYSSISSGTHSQSLIRRWDIKGGGAVVYQATVVASSGHLIFGEQSATGRGLLRDYQHQFIDGVPQTPGETPGQWLEFANGLDLAPTLNPTTIVATTHYVADDGHRVGFAQVTGAQGMVSCTWNVIR